MIKYQVIRLLWDYLKHNVPRKEYFIYFWYLFKFNVLREKVIMMTFASKAVYRSIISFVSGIWGCTLFIVHCANSYGDSDDKDEFPLRSEVLMMVIARDYIHSTHWDRPQGCSFLPPCCPLSDSPLSEACSWNKLNQDQKSSCWKNVKV